MNFDGEWVRRIRIEDLPKSFRELAEQIGLAVVDYLHPGAPREENEELAGRLGAYVAVKLSPVLGGQAPYYPKIEAVLRELVYRLIREEAAALRGHTDKYRLLARKYGYTEVWIRQLVDHPEEDPQQDLFAANS